MTSRPVLLTSNSILCHIQSCKIELDSDALGKSATDNDTCPILSTVGLQDAVLNNHEQALAKQLLSKYREVFSEDEMDVGLTSLVKHQIRLTNDSKIPPLILT